MTISKCRHCGSTTPTRDCGASGSHQNSFECEMIQYEIEGDAQVPIDTEEAIRADERARCQAELVSTGAKLADLEARRTRDFRCCGGNDDVPTEHCSDCHDFGWGESDRALKDKLAEARALLNETRGRLYVAIACGGDTRRDIVLGVLDKLDKLDAEKKART